MAVNVFGTPITALNLKGKQKHHPYNAYNHSYRARVAFQKKNAEGKDVAARNFVKQLCAEFGEGTMCLVYNATGDTVTLNTDNYWEGHACESPCPLVISNGQWGAFLIAPSTENNATSAAFIYQGGNSDGKQYQWLTAFTTSPGTNNKVWAEIEQAATRLFREDPNKWKALKEKLSKSRNHYVAVEDDLILFASIGGRESPMVEAILTTVDTVSD